MKTLTQQTKDAAAIILGIGVLIIAASLLNACGPAFQGPQGAPGPAGPQGAPGGNCTVSTLPVNLTVDPNGGSLISCPDGTSSVVLNGANGANGANGTNGSDGSPGTVVSVVQFCQGTVSYPSTFLEFGVCISDNLYGVYSLNGGFWALLPPGAYSSDGVNASCDFTIGANCSVSN